MLRNHIFRHIKSKYKHLHFLIFCADMNATMLKEIWFIEAFSAHLAGMTAIIWAQNLKIWRSTDVFCLMCLKCIHNYKSVLVCLHDFWLTNFSFLFSVDFQTYFSWKQQWKITQWKIMQNTVSMINALYISFWFFNGVTQ